MHSVKGILEKDLIDRVIDGDQTAFEFLFHFYYPGLVIYSAQFTADRMEAEEIVQDFFVRFWNNHQKLVPSDSLKSYVFSSVKNSCLNFLKHKKIEEKYINQMLELSDRHLAYDPDLYTDSDLQGKIKKTIDLLPKRCKEIFNMSRMQGKKNNEIAIELNISKRTVETQISNALKIFKERLKDYTGLLILMLHLGSLQ